ncbi:MAG: hypothetical protein ACP5RT_01135 [Candidatus Micrarchaeia archaeon]
MEKDSFIAKIVYRLIKKHIVGNTMGSAIKKAKQLNSKGILTSITFLSDAPKELSKSNYITATYIQLIREVSRPGLKASIHIPIEQIGEGLSSEAALANIKKLVEYGNKYGVFIWFEVGDINDKIVDNILLFKGVGIACGDIKKAAGFVKKSKPKTLKLMLSKKLGGNELELIKKLAETTKLVVLLQNDPTIEKLISRNNYKNSLIFEFQLGYSEKKLWKLAKKGASIGVYLPFGKDWTSYAIKNMPSGYMHSIATNLLAETEKGEDNGKKRKG